MTSQGKLKGVLMLRRFLIATSLSVPGIALAFVAKPLSLGDGPLFLGILLAFLAPLVWLVTPAARKQSPPEMKESTRLPAKN